MTNEGEISSKDIFLIGDPILYNRNMHVVYNATVVTSNIAKIVVRDVPKAWMTT